MTLLIDTALLDHLSAEAAGLPRLRKNRNFHRDDQAPSHRLLNAIEPGSYIRPHRHLDPTKDESIVVLRGKLAVLIFDETGAVTAKHVMAPGSATVAIDISSGTMHTMISLESKTVFFEAKAGPYLPLTKDEFAPWSPAEGSAEARAFLQQLIASCA
jgi:cupin fold WbuC family metalloprotein